MMLERYDVIISEGAPDPMLPEVEGDWVRYADAQATIADLQGQLAAMTESRDAWQKSQEGAEKAYMALVTQIPAERFDYDPVNLALLESAKVQEEIGRKQIDALQQRVAQLEAWKQGATREFRDIEQVAGKALGYVWFKDDQKNFPGATDADGVCIGEHVPGTIVAELASQFTTLQADHARVLGLVRTACERWRAQTNAQEGISFRMAMKELEASLPAQPAQGGA